MAKAKANRRRPAESRSRLPLMIGAAAVVVIALIAIVASSGGDGGGDGETAAPGGETRSVTVEGQVLPTAASDGQDVAVGRGAPLVTGQSFDGNPITIGPSVGAPQLVFVVAHWCPHCQKEVPVIVDWLRDGGRPAGVELRAISTAVSEDRPNYPPSTWLAEEGWTVPTIADDEEGSAARALGVSAYPFFVALDREGKVVARASGELSIDEIEQLLARARGAAA